VSTFAVPIVQIGIEPHPNADALELATVGGYRAVVRMGEYRSGDICLYLPEASVLPDALIVELGLERLLSGSKSNRVKAVRLRGELSQGIVCRPEGIRHLLTPEHLGEDLAALLGVAKWVPEVPVSMSGMVKPCEELPHWSDIENIKAHMDMFESGEMVEATEKLHGTFCMVALLPDDTFVATSKGMGAKGLVLEESESNVYWRAVHHHDLKEKLHVIRHMDRSGVWAIAGEVYGSGIQDLHYGHEGSRQGEPGFRAFDLYNGRQWSPPREARLCLVPNGVHMVPLLHSGPYNYGLLEELATGKETLSGRDLHLREGLVVRPRGGDQSGPHGGRRIAKFISPRYLLRKGETTEFE